MTDIEIIYFRELKSHIQARYLEDHNPSDEEISNWKGIDIIYFQEDLRKKTKGNISEKSFYTYFKNVPVSKIPRIDILNLLSIYAGFDSWFDFKKRTTLHADIVENLVDKIGNKTFERISEEKNEIGSTQEPKEEVKTPISNPNFSELQISTTDNQLVKKNTDTLAQTEKSINPTFFYSLKKYLWLCISSILAILVGLLFFQDQLFSRELTYTFIDADRNSLINNELSVRILKDNESPIMFKVKPNNPFIYTTKSTSLKMVVQSPYYKTDTIFRNLETAPDNESIELKPNDFAIMLYHYSNPNSISGIKTKRESLQNLISDQALIYQVYDNETYGVETLNKSRYITLVTTPTTSLKNMEVIDTQIKNGKIILIKFRISSDEND